MKIPRGRHDGRGRATPRMPSSFTSKYGGKCRICGERIEPGAPAQKAANGGMQHPRCSGVEKDLHLPPDQRARRPAPPDPPANARTDLVDDTADRVLKRDPPTDEFGMRIGTASCPACGAGPGVPCVGGGANWMHRARSTRAGE